MSPILGDSGSLKDPSVVGTKKPIVISVTIDRKVPQQRAASFGQRERKVGPPSEVATAFFSFFTGQSLRWRITH